MVKKKTKKHNAYTVNGTKCETNGAFRPLLAEHGQTVKCFTFSVELPWNLFFFYDVALSIL